MKMLVVNSPGTERFTPRQEDIGGKPHVVAPVILLTEGVHAGSGGPVLYQANEIQKSVGAWNGVPVTLQHPTVNGQLVSASKPEAADFHLGFTRNVVFKDKKLRGEICVNIERAKSKAPGVLTQLNSGGQVKLEVSTGLFSGFAGVPGLWRGEKYYTIVSNIRPDHLALLPGGEGACSWKDGCGIRANVLANSGGKGGSGMEIEELIEITVNQLQDSQSNPDALVEIAGRFAKQMGLTVLEASFNETRRAIQMAMDGWDRRDGPGAPVVHYVQDVYPSSFVYSKEQPNQPTKYFQCNYTIDDNGNVTVDEAADHMEVRPRMQYVQVANEAEDEDEEDGVEVHGELVDNEDDTPQSRARRARGIFLSQ